MKRSVVLSVLVASVACVEADSKPRPPAVKPATGIVFTAVRVDPTTYAEQRLGKIRFDLAPPYKATLVDGDAKLRVIVVEMNTLDHVMSAGLISSPPQRVLREEDQFFRIMRHGWLQDTHQIRLRLVGAPSPTQRRYDVIAFEEGERDVVLGEVAIDDMGYLEIVGGPKDRRARLGEIVDEANDRDGESVRVPPPGQQRGSWFRSIERGTSSFFAMQRDRLYDRDDILLVPHGHARPDTVAIAGNLGHGGSRNWIATHVPAGMSRSSSAVVRLSGPPGGPLGVTITQYENMAYTASALVDHVTAAHGKEQAFTIGAPAEVEIAGRKLIAVVYQTGTAGPGRAAHLVAMWPELVHHNAKDEIGDAGVMIDLMTAGADTPPSATRILEHPKLSIVADSLFVDFDAAP